MPCNAIFACVDRDRDRAGIDRFFHSFLESGRIFPNSNFNAANSAPLRCRHSPGFNSPSSKVPIRTRMMRVTGKPILEPTSRICRLRPSLITIRSQAPLPARLSKNTLAGRVLYPSAKTTPRRQAEICSASGFADNKTRYSFSCP